MALTDNGSISLEGVPQLSKALRNYRMAINREASKGLRAAGLGIIADAQRNLKANTSWVTGLLANSGRVIYGGQGYDTGSTDARTSREATDSLLGASDAGADIGLDVGFFDASSKGNGYALYVEYGRPPGKMPPPSALAEWWYKKHRVRDRKTALALGWGTAVNIARQGTKPHPFFVPAVTKWTDRIVKTISDAARRVINMSK